MGAAGAASSEDEPPEDAGAGERRGPAPLLDRIRRDRQDLEAKIAKLKGYISASSEMMNKLKDLPVRRDVDFGLTIAHAGGSPGQPERRNCRLSRHAIVYGGTVYHSGSRRNTREQTLLRESPFLPYYFKHFLFIIPLKQTVHLRKIRIF